MKKLYNKIMSCFLFGKQAEKHKVVFWIWNWFFIIISAFGISVLSLSYAFAQHGWAMFRGYFENPLILLLNTLPVVIFMAVLYCIIGRAWIAFLGTAVPIYLMSCGNYFKLLFRDDPFKFSDVTLIGTALKFTDDYNVSLNPRLIVGIAAIALGTLFLAFFVRGHIRKRFGIPITLVFIISFFPLYHNVYISDSIYDELTLNPQNTNNLSATPVYISRGFIYPFLNSIPKAFPEKPKNYSNEAAIEILSEYTADEIPEDKRVNIIGIQLEAFNDFSRLGVSGISDDVYAEYHKFEAESYTGTLVTNLFGGGTVDTERSFLTGNSVPENFGSDTNSYVRYLKKQGYYAEGGHPCYDWFYNRLNINSYLGFDEYYFFEDRYSDMTNGRISLDNTFIPDVYNLFSLRDKSVPYLGFSVTYQGHGPYPDNLINPIWDGESWNGECSNESTYYIMNNYFGSVRNTAENISLIVDMLRFDDAPVVLVLFGDHNPWLGNGGGAYADLGINMDTSTVEGFYNYYSTRYLIWANDSAKEILGKDFSGEGPTISPCFLMNVLFEQCGWGGDEYMKLASDVMKKVSVINNDGFYVEDGVLKTKLSDEGEELVNKYMIAQYYRKMNLEL